MLNNFNLSNITFIYYYYCYNIITMIEQLHNDINIEMKSCYHRVGGDSNVFGFHPRCQLVQMSVDFIDADIVFKHMSFVVYLSIIYTYCMRTHTYIHTHIHMFAYIN